MIPFNQTKIICTIGPATESKEMMTSLINAGMDVMRMNFSHGNHESHLERLKTLYEINTDLNTNVASLLDTKGPEVRTHLFKNSKVTVEKDSIVTIHMNEILGDETKFSVSYENLYLDVLVGGSILVDDGYLELKVMDIDLDKKTIKTKALNTHIIKDRRGINIPGAKLNMPFISEKDHADLKWGCLNRVDYVAASFVRRASDVKEIKDIFAKCGNDHTQIIAKIENAEGVLNIDEIIEIADGVMIARGDLGVEVPAEDVPVIQKSIIGKCHIKGKISVTATQMLESMIDNPRPTRAEVSDVANAIFDGTDAIMLSGESAIGIYPIESVEVMNNIAQRIERELDRSRLVKRANKNSHDGIETSIAVSVAYSVIQGDTDIIVAPTVSGNTAKLISKFRPDARIIALTPNAEKARSLALYNGVEARVFNLEPDTEYLIKEAIKLVKAEYNCKPGTRVVVTGGFPIGTQTNSFRIIDIT